jgi:hypothetical protein
MDCTAEQTIWLAGFLDGEGSIGIMKRGEGDTGDYQPRVSITSTNRQLLEEIKEWVGGGCLNWTRRNPTDHRKDVFTLAVSNRIALNLIQKIRPYMRLKTEQADVFLRYYAVAVGPVGTNRRGTRKTVQDDLYHAMRQLNRKGKAAESQRI